jgi:L-aspartate oxidase
VFGARIARDIAGGSAAWSGQHVDVGTLDFTDGDEDGAGDAAVRQSLRETMSRYAGVERSGEGLRRALGVIEDLAEGREGSGQLGNMLTVARLIVTGALKRCESRGGHYRLDHPEADPAQARRAFQRHDEAVRLGAEQALRSGQAAEAAGAAASCQISNLRASSL